MYCSEFLEIYSDYRDGLIADPKVVQSVEHHLRHCERCMHYDALVARGVMALRSTSDMEPARTLKRKWSQRRAGLSAAPDNEDLDEVRPAHAGIMVALMVATGLALLVWSPQEQESVVVSTPPVPPTVETVEVVRPVEPMRVLNTDPRVEAPERATPTFLDRDRLAPERAVSFETSVAPPR